MSSETVYKFTMCSILATTVAAKQYCLNDIFQDCITAQCMGLYFVLQMQFNTPGDLIIDDSVRALALSLDFIEANTKMFLHLEPVKLGIMSKLFSFARFRVLVSCCLRTLESFLISLISMRGRLLMGT